MGNYKDVLKEYGFRYNEDTDEWVKPLGFGRSIKCIRILGSLFEMSQGKKIYFSYWVESLKEFKEIISNITDK